MSTLLRKQIVPTCCQWKRSDNDTLYDTQTNQPFCGTCWHTFLQPKLLSKQISFIDESKEDCAIVTNHPSFHPLSTMKHTDGKTYIISKKRNLVFSTLSNIPQPEDDNINLKCAGELINNNTEIKLYKVTSVASTVEFPFNIKPSPEDHCETPLSAYKDITPILKFIARSLNKTPSTLRIWDPYYCAGSIKKRLSTLGFHNVHNENIDFYSISQIPEYDILLTNPPYSTNQIDHVQKLLQFVSCRGKPWLVLQPNYVYMKGYWDECTSRIKDGPRPFFLTPGSSRKYKYKTPCGLRNVNNVQCLKTSPFVTFWYCWFGKQLTHSFYQWFVNSYDEGDLSLACSEFFLPDSFKDSSDKTRKKKRKDKNKNMLKQTDNRGIHKNKKKRK